MEIQKQGNTYGISQTDHINRLIEKPDKNVDKKEFITQRARRAYITAEGRPDLSFGFSRASQIIPPDSSPAKDINKNIGHV